MNTELLARYLRRFRSQPVVPARPPMQSVFRESFPNAMDQRFDPTCLVDTESAL